MKNKYYYETKIIEHHEQYVRNIGVFR